MKFSSFSSSLALAFVLYPSASTATSTTTVSYDATYDNFQESLNNVACSNGANGLVTKGFTTFGSLPDFPFIGGAPAVAAWNSTNCGTCWELTYTSPSGSISTIDVLAIDTSGNGFNIAEDAMNVLTDGQAVQLGRITVTFEQVDASVCGL